MIQEATKVISGHRFDALFSRSLHVCLLQAGWHPYIPGPGWIDNVGNDVCIDLFGDNQDQALLRGHEESINFILNLIK